MGTTVLEQPSKQQVDKHQPEMTDVPRSFHAGVMKNELLNSFTRGLWALTAMAMGVISCCGAQIHECIYPEDGSGRFLRKSVNLYLSTRSQLPEDDNKIVILSST